MSNKAVILGGNYYIGLSIIRCLGSKGIHVACVDYSKEGAYGLKTKYLKETLIAPHYKENPLGLLSFLIDYSKKQDIKPVLFPSADQYVEFIDTYMNELRDYYLFPEVEKGLYMEAMEKSSLSLLAKKHGMRLPVTISGDEENATQKVIDEIGFPCLIKPVDSPSFSKKYSMKLIEVSNVDEFFENFTKFKNDGFKVIIQQKIHGFDDCMYTFDAYLNKNSKVTNWTTCHKQRQYPINYGASVYTRQEYVPELLEIGGPFLEAIGWKGFAEIEFKKDEKTGDFYLIEINTRTTNLNHLLYKCGLNMPLIAYNEMTGKGVDSYSVTKNKRLYFWYSFEDLLAVKGYIKTGQLKFSKVFFSYFHRKAHAIWSFRDPAPYFCFFRHNILKRIKNKIMGKK